MNPPLLMRQRARVEKEMKELEEKAKRDVREGLDQTNDDGE